MGPFLREVTEQVLASPQFAGLARLSVIDLPSFQPTYGQNCQKDFPSEPHLSLPATIPAILLFASN